MVHYVIFDQIFKVQHLRFKSFGIYFARGKIPFHKEKKSCLTYICNVSNEMVTKTQIHKEQIHTGDF